MVRFNHFVTEFNKLDSDIKKIFFDFFANENPFLVVGEKHWRPSVDIYSTDKGIIVKAELAGVKQKDLSLSFLDNKLAIKGERHDYTVTEEIACQQIEIPYGDFERNINIRPPEDKQIDEENIKAAFKEGILYIYLPFENIQKNEKKIEIKIEDDE